MNQSKLHSSRLISFMNASTHMGSSCLPGSHFIPLTASMKNEALLSFDVVINSTTLYLGQYYKVTFTLTNNSPDLLTSIEINCELEAYWRLLDTNPYPIPTYITLLKPGEQITFTSAMQLIKLPLHNRCTINSYVSYHINYEPLTYIRNSAPINCSASLSQAAVNLSFERKSESTTAYNVGIQNIGTIALKSPVLYIFMPPSIQLLNNSLFVNESSVPQAKPNKGIHLYDMPPQTLYSVRFSTQFSEGYPDYDLPKVQLVCNDLMFCPLPTK